MPGGAEIGLSAWHALAEPPRWHLLARPSCGPGPRRRFRSPLPRRCWAAAASCSAACPPSRRWRATQASTGGRRGETCGHSARNTGQQAGGLRGRESLPALCKQHRPAGGGGSGQGGSLRSHVAPGGDQHAWEFLRSSFWPAIPGDQPPLAGWLAGGAVTSPVCGPLWSARPPTAALHRSLGQLLQVFWTSLTSLRQASQWLATRTAHGACGSCGWAAMWVLAPGLVCQPGRGGSYVPACIIFDVLHAMQILDDLIDGWVANTHTGMPGCCSPRAVNTQLSSHPGGSFLLLRMRALFGWL